MGVSNVAIHELDICRWLLGDEYKSGQVLKVRQSACSTKGYDNPQIVLLETQSGARIDVEVQVADAYGYDIQCQVVCEKGTVNLPDPYAVVKRSERNPFVPDPDRLEATALLKPMTLRLTHWVKTLERRVSRMVRPHGTATRCLRRSRHAQPFPRHESVPADRDDG